MYEIWLMLVIVYEIALSIWPWLLALAVLWLLLLMLARGGRAGGWSTCLPKAITLGVLVGVVIFFVTPIWNKSGLGEMKYWVDWANLLGIAVAWAVAGTLFAWPLLTWISKSRQTA
ncbi:hypothetical protein [Ottowia sp.]|uniref:hypothetical protein n=1 Tax=Ottowia sp. TaxID=1898956 RepID=UPI002CA4B60C|nr:hypothetical protein [Ottowia sp.]HRN77277.1 hypothetical protein [Ottowia sp.]HRQ02597.1 hypothetical protein [Ottowia sp.]